MNLAGNSNMKYNSCIFMVKLRNSLFRNLSLESKIQHKHQQCDKMLSTFMKITRVNKLKIKIIALYSSVTNCEHIALRAEMSCNLVCFC